MVWKVSFFLTICLSLGHTLRPKGVRPDFASFYDPNSAFNCLDGSAEIPFDQVNDDYCDCKVRNIRQITQIIVIYCDFTRFFNYRLQRQYEIDIDTDPDSDLDVAASDPGWVTDGLWMDNSKHAVYTTSLRCTVGQKI